MAEFEYSCSNDACVLRNTGVREDGCHIHDKHIVIWRQDDDISSYRHKTLQIKFHSFTEILM